MRNTQVSVWEIQYPNTLCQYQDTVELQETLLQGCIMDKGLAQGTRTMMLSLITAAHKLIKVAGGIATATLQTSTVSTTVDHTLPMLMV